MKIHIFGDSWAAGAELVGEERPFSYHLEKSTKIECVNHGIEGISFGFIYQEFLYQMKNIKYDDFVIIIIPPDVRWFTEINGIWHNITMSKYDLDSDDKDYVDEVNFYLSKLHTKKEYFQFFYSSFISSIQGILNKNKTNFIIQHNYGIFKIHPLIREYVDKGNFIDPYHSLTSLLGGYDIDYIMNNISSPDTTPFIGKYFEGKQTHPNDLGHREIARLISKHKNFTNWLET